MQRQVSLFLILALLGAAGANRALAQVEQEASSVTEPTAPVITETAPPSEVAPPSEPAATLASDPPIPPVSEPANVDMAALTAQLEAGEQGETMDVEEPSPVQVYGFADVGYRQLFVEQSNPWLLFFNRHPSMYVGNLNVYLDAKLSSRWRTLMEVRFTYLPHGAPDTNLSDDTIDRASTRTADYTDFTRSKGLGSIMIERAFIEYSPFSWLSLKAGQWLTPYGIWNVDHGSPVIIGVSRPFIIGSELIPEHQVGVMADGSVPLRGDFDLSYMLAASNGRTDLVPYEDLDKNKALTARAAVNYQGLGKMTLGSTFYMGRHTDSINQLVFEGETPKSREKVNRQIDEVSYAFDFRWVYKSLHLQSEWILNDRRFTERGRITSAKGGLRPDKRNWGGYGLVGYRTPWWTIMPYCKAEYSPEPQAQELGTSDQIVMLNGGLNLRPLANVVFKAEYVYAWFPDGDPKSFAGEALHGLDLQIAWSF